MNGKLIYDGVVIDVLVDLDSRKRINSITINGLKYTYSCSYDIGKVYCARMPITRFGSNKSSNRRTKSKILKK